MKSRMTCLAFLALLASLPAVPAVAEVPEKYTNLEVLPEDIGKQELLATMKGFTAALGMRCDDCHVQKVPGDFDSFDWASDELPEKDVARGMMRMVQKLNTDLLPTATGEDDAAVSCVTCHHGLSHPRTLEQDLMRTIHEDGVAEAETRYRALREKYYGTAAFDFSASSLENVVANLATADDLDGARRMAQLNLELNPDDLRGRLQLAQIEIAAGNEEAARAEIGKVLAVEPDNRHAQRLQQQLGR